MRMLSFIDTGEFQTISQATSHISYSCTSQASCYLGCTTSCYLKNQSHLLDWCQPLPQPCQLQFQPLPIQPVMPPTMPTIISVTSHASYDPSQPHLIHARYNSSQYLIPPAMRTNTTKDPDITTTTSTAYGSECNYPVSFSINRSITQKTFTTTHGAEMVAIGMSQAA